MHCCQCRATLACPLPYCSSSRSTRRRNVSSIRVCLPPSTATAVSEAKDELQAKAGTVVVPTTLPHPAMVGERQPLAEETQVTAVVVLEALAHIQVRPAPGAGRAVRVLGSGLRPLLSTRLCCPLLRHVTAFQSIVHLPFSSPSDLFSRAASLVVTARIADARSCLPCGVPCQ